MQVHSPSAPLSSGQTALTSVGLFALISLLVGVILYLVLDTAFPAVLHPKTKGIMVGIGMWAVCSSLMFCYYLVRYLCRRG